MKKKCIKSVCSNIHKHADCRLEYTVLSSHPDPRSPGCGCSACPTGWSLWCSGRCSARGASSGAVPCDTPGSCTAARGRASRCARPGGPTRAGGPWRGRSGRSTGTGTWVRGQGRG